MPRRFSKSSVDLGAMLIFIGIAAGGADYIASLGLIELPLGLSIGFVALGAFGAILSGAWFAYRGSR